MAIDFPASPTTGDQVTSGSIVWEYDGEKWVTLKSLFNRGILTDGTEAAPGTVFNGDTDTGIYSPGANTFAISTGGVQRVELDANEVVFNEGGHNYDFRVEGDTQPNLIFADASADTITFRDDVIIDSNGNVGIGTTSPDQKLHVYGNSGTTFVSVGDQTRSAPYGYFGADASAGKMSLVSRSAHPLTFQVETSEVGRFDTSGRLLIGTTTSQVDEASLQSYKPSGGNQILVQSDDLGTATSIFRAKARRSGGDTNVAELGVYRHSGITDPCSFIRLQAEDTAVLFYWTDNSNIFRSSTNSAHIGTTSGTVVGTQTSDERVKNILGPVEYGLETLKQIEPVRFSLKSQPDIEQLGFIAQQVQPLVPQSVFDTGEHIEGEPEDAPTKLGMEYVALIPVLVNAAKEMATRIETLEARLTALEGGAS
jgi:hypothetical protein